MQITLMEDDGIFNNGIPKNVVLHVTFDDDKQIRVPYSADKSISDLYRDLQKIAPKAIDQSMRLGQELVEAHKEFVLPKPKPEEYKQPAINNRKGVIEKEDIVTLVRLEDRGLGATCLLVVGNQYRVIGIKSTGVTLPGTDCVTSQVQSYDIVDDNAARPERTMVFPHEVVLFRKRTPVQKAVKPKVEEILACPSCKEENALALDKDTFKGTCGHCNAEIKIKRIIRKCTNKKCKGKASLFEIDGGYRGNCPECNAVVEENDE